MSLTAVDRLLGIAAAEVGTSEKPKYSNTVKYNTWYYGRSVSGPAYPWCMAFVQWCCDRAGVLLPARTASCSALMRAAQAVDQWVDHGYQRGDIIIFRFREFDEIQYHTGICESVTNRTVVTIDGNTGSGSEANGGAVMRRERSLGYVVGAVRPNYEKEDDDMDVSKLTGADCLEIINKAQVELASNPLPAWAEKEVGEAIAAGITDGTNMMQLVPRYQAAIMALRASRKGCSCSVKTSH